MGEALRLTIGIFEDIETAQGQKEKRRLEDLYDEWYKKWENAIQIHDEDNTNGYMMILLECLNEAAADLPQELQCGNPDWDTKR